MNMYLPANIHTSRPPVCCHRILPPHTTDELSHQKKPQSDCHGKETKYGREQKGMEMNRKIERYSRRLTPNPPLHTVVIFFVVAVVTIVLVVSMVMVVVMVAVVSMLVVVDWALQSLR